MKYNIQNEKYNRKLCLYFQRRYYMKLLKITAEGLPLFDGTLELPFYASQRISNLENDGISNLFSNYYSNNVEIFAGINASGKTTVLRVILFVLDLLNEAAINQSQYKDVLGNSKRVELNTYYYSQGYFVEPAVCRLQTVISSEMDELGILHYFIAEERYWRKKPKSIKTKKELTDFTDTPERVRSNDEQYLKSDTSIIIAVNRVFEGKPKYLELLSMTNNNQIGIQGDVSKNLLSFLDPSIEKISIKETNGSTNGDASIHLKFIGKEEIVLQNIKDLNQYLSSGTIKGITIFRYAEIILRNGAYLIVDELENHFNKEIVSKLVQLFMDRRVNKYGATLIFSTHYPELLDCVNRNDCIFIMKNIHGITADNMTSLLKRSDIKRSDAYESDLLQGTAPSYEAYIQLKKALIASMK